MLHGFPLGGNFASVARKRIAVANLPLIRPSGATFPTGEGFKETGSLIFFPHRFTLSPNYCKMLYKENGLLCLHGTADRQNNYRWCFLWQFSINVFF